MATDAVIPQTVQIVEPDDGFTLRLARKPDAIVAEATLCANALMAAVRKNNWAQKFGNKEHLFFEAWAFLASMYRVTARVKETRLVQVGEVTGYEAFAEAFHIPSGVVISTADSMCLDDEDNWSDRPVKVWDEKARAKVATGEFTPVPLFQLRSMAQTRAMSKALRGPFSWIIAMAGYAPTPADEMGKKQQTAKADPNPPQQQQQSAGNGNVISEAQRKRLWAIAKSLNLSNDAVSKILKDHGFESSDSITRDKYEAIISEVEAQGNGQ